MRIKPLINEPDRTLRWGYYAIIAVGVVWCCMIYMLWTT